ncbi:MAG TPA: hypothetical protein DCZ95_09130 [Verrucomicrobia bacterium]|nr:MAG: hypothetical protein A2X46_03315 [Lentisphaerae bacterium GWF2_57_35]HBA84240.1 hypothetical protein [Verrucomicrobiota bacterium]
MKKFPALAILEFRDISAGLFATDAMIKKSPIALLKAGIITGGRYMTLIGGSTASVDEAFQEGIFWGKDSLIDKVMLPDIHEKLHDAVLGRRHPVADGAMAVIETPTASSNVRAAELALKGAPVELVEIRLAESRLAGKGLSIYRGELHDIEAAVEMAVSFLRRAHVEVLSRIIAAPHETLTDQISGSTFFHDAKLLELDGEVD